MKVSDDIIIQNDIESIINKQVVEWTKFRNKVIFITGSTGMIGGYLLRTFALADKTFNLGMKIYALVRNKNKAESLLSEIEDSSDILLIVQDMTKEIALCDHVDYIIHCANITDSWSFVHKPVETIETSLKGCKNILKFAVREKPSSVLYLSTAEIYGQSDKIIFKENEYGNIDPLITRSSYPGAKKMCECLCKAYVEEYGIHVKIARPTQTFGPGVNYKDNRVFAEFARAVVENRDIVLHTRGRTERSYCYTRDLVNALLILMMNGQDGEAYNIANEDTAISIYSMAQMLAEKYFNDKNRVVIKIEDNQLYGYNPEGKTYINCDKIKELGWKPEVGLEEMFDNLISSIRLEKAKG